MDNLLHVFSYYSMLCIQVPMLLLYLMKTCRRCGGVRSGYGFYGFARIAIEHNYIDQIFSLPACISRSGFWNNYCKIENTIRKFCKILPDLVNTNVRLFWIVFLFQKRDIHTLSIRDFPQSISNIRLTCTNLSCARFNLEIC